MHKCRNAQIMMLKGKLQNIPEAKKKTCHL